LRPVIEAPYTDSVVWSATPRTTEYCTSLRWPGHACEFCDLGAARPSAAGAGFEAIDIKSLAALAALGPRLRPGGGG
jgi:hypothetical protein